MARIGNAVIGKEARFKDKLLETTAADVAKVVEDMPMSEDSTLETGADSTVSVTSANTGCEPFLG